MTEQELIPLASVPTKMPSAFRLFVNEKWMEHKDEIMAWTGQTVDYDAKYYYNKHRWLLKSMYKEQKNG
jgi:hypothetical protein